MIKHVFKYCATHKADEAYMQDMCKKGWAATKLVEGFWTFEKCEPGEYYYRICYLRGMKNEEVDILKQKLSSRGIEMISRYSFWGMCRSCRPFSLYNEQEETEIIKKIYAPMPIGAIVSWIIFFVSLYLAIKVNCLFNIATVLVGIYACMCTWLGISYHRLLSENNIN